MAQVQMALPGLTPPPPAPDFDGGTYEQEVDKKRMTAQLSLVRELMSDGRWWSIAQLADAIWKSGYMATPQGISARIRDLRKARYGGREVDRRRKTPASGDYLYRLVSTEEQERRAAARLAEMGVER